MPIDSGIGLSIRIDNLRVKKEKEKDREDQEIFISLTTFWQKGNGCISTEW